MTDPIRIYVHRKRGSRWIMIAMYEFSTPEVMADTLKFLDSKCKAPIMSEYVAFLEAQIK